MFGLGAGKFPWSDSLHALREVRPKAGRQPPGYLTKAPVIEACAAAHRHLVSYRFSMPTLFLKSLLFDRITHCNILNLEKSKTHHHASSILPTLTHMLFKKIVNYCPLHLWVRIFSWMGFGSEQWLMFLRKTGVMSSGGKDPQNFSSTGNPWRLILLCGEVNLIAKDLEFLLLVFLCLLLKINQFLSKNGRILFNS